MLELLVALLDVVVDSALVIVVAVELTVVEWNVVAELVVVVVLALVPVVKLWRVQLVIVDLCCLISHTSDLKSEKIISSSKQSIKQ